ncbi:transposon ty3-I gag-pol polyprotein [Tanacetum coccineum]
MVVSTRNTLYSSSNGSPLVLDDETKRFLAETIARMVEGSLTTMQRSMEEMANNITALTLLWHSQFVRIHGNNYETTAKEYEDAFDNLLSRVEVSEDHVVSLFMATLNVVKKKNKSTFTLNNSRYSSSSSSTFKPLVTNPETAKGHKCSGQLYSLVLLPEIENEGGEFLEEDESLVDIGLMDLQAPLISLKALTVADGNKLVTNAKCKEFKWQFAPNVFTTDVMLLPFGGCEMVLKIQWLATLGDIRFNFYELRMDFKYNGQKVLATSIHHILQKVIAAYEDVFAVPIDLPPRRDQDHTIPLIEGAQPVNIRPYRHPPSQKDAIEGMVAELLEEGVIKKNNRQLNKQTIKDKFLIPIIEELIDELHWSQLFTKLDLRSGYHQIRKNDADIAKTSFRTHEGHNKFLVMPFGLTNASSTFQSLMNEVFKQYLRKLVLVFFDDILIYSQTMKDHALHLRTMLEIMRLHKLYANRSKCVFGTDKVEYLGHVISAMGVGTTEDSFKDMLVLLKQAMVSVPVLRLLNFSKEFTLETDASGVGLGAVLLQEGHPIKWRGYLLDMHFKIKTDHFSLIYLLDQRMSTPTQLKWLPKLMGFDYEIQYKKGVENVTADALFRLQSSSELFTMISSSLTTNIYQRIADTWKTDVKLQKIIEKIQQGQTVKGSYSWANQDLRRKGRLEVGNDQSLRT